MSGLVGHWPLHEDSGDAADLSGNGNDGTVNGATQGVWGRGGLAAYSFDGTDDWVDIPKPINSLPEDFTYSLWIRTDDNVSILSDFDGNDYTVNIAIDSDTVQGTVFDGTTSVEADSGVTVTDLNWYHVVFVKRGDIIEIHVDGDLEDTDDTSSITDGFSNTENYHLGEDIIAGGGPFYYGGLISDFRLYNRALSPQEIETLYDWGSTDYSKPSLTDGTDSGAISRWTFDDDTQTTVATDSWGDNDGNINGAVYTSDAIEDQALSFDGTDDEVDTGADLGNEVIGSGFTVSGWVNPSSSGSVQHIIGENISSGDRSYRVFVTASDEISGTIYNDSDSSLGITTDSVVTTGSWYHFSFKWTGSESSIFFNGVRQDSRGVSTMQNSSVNTLIGNINFDSRFNGEIDDVRIYDRALSDWEVFELYRWGAKGRDMRERTVIE